jgi:hypothetical protein
MRVELKVSLLFNSAGANISWLHCFVFCTMPDRFEAEFKLRGSCGPMFLADPGLNVERLECNGLARQAASGLIICRQKEPKILP